MREIHKPRGINILKKGINSLLNHVLLLARHENLGLLDFNVMSSIYFHYTYAFPKLAHILRSILTFFSNDLQTDNDPPVKKSNCTRKTSILLKRRECGYQLNVERMKIIMMYLKNKVFVSIAVTLEHSQAIGGVV